MTTIYEVVYVVRGKIAKDALSTIKKGDTVWLGWTDEGGGWHQWVDGSPARAKRFSSPEAARKASCQNAGPWYSMPDPYSVEVLPAHYYPPVPARLELV
jgi:hypothetical protein